MVGYFYIIFVNTKVTITVNKLLTVTKKLLVFKFNFQSSKKVRVHLYFKIGHCIM